MLTQQQRRQFHVKVQFGRANLLLRNLVQAATCNEVVKMTVVMFELFCSNTVEASVFESCNVLRCACVSDKSAISTTYCIPRPNLNIISSRGTINWRNCANIHIQLGFSFLE